MSPVHLFIIVHHKSIGTLPLNQRDEKFIKADRTDTINNDRSCFAVLLIEM